MNDTPFESLHHLVVVPVDLNGVERRFVLDSGIGLTLVRNTIEGCVPQHGSFTGKRMSGQEVSVPLAIAPALAFAGVEQQGVTVGVLDMSGFAPELDDVDGFVSLAFFANQPFTVDYEERIIRDGTHATGAAVPLRLERDGPSLTAFMALTIPGGEVEAEVDMGSDVLILDETFVGSTGAQLDGEGSRRVEGVDETGHAFARTFTRLRGTIHPTDAPSLALRDPEVMFQRIIYDALVGHAFLSGFDVTWDLPRSRLLLGMRR